ncbi:MAG: metal-binding protein [Solirubrobacterales bacterium]|nr:MAG: metal-binding protein [Solirubrobacterales bacterium]
MFDTRTPGRQPGSARSDTRIVPAPADLRVALACVPTGADVKLTVLLEAVSEGVLVTGEASAPVTGECARCLEPTASSVDVAFRELYEHDDARYEEAGDDSDRRFLRGDLLDLEPAFRDAVVLALPLAPLCRPDCAGLCAECGVRLADAGPGHDHDSAPDPRWARLRELDMGRERRNGASAVDGQEA